MLHWLESSSVGPAFGCVVVRARPANSIADDGGFEMITSGYRARVCSPGRLPTRCHAPSVGAARDASRPGAHPMRRPPGAHPMRRPPGARPMRRPPGAHPMRRPPAVVLGFAASVWSRTSGRASRLLTSARRARPRVRLRSPPVSTRDEPVGVAVIGVLREVGRRPVRRHGTRGAGRAGYVLFTVDEAHDAANPSDGWKAPANWLEPVLGARAREQLSDLLVSRCSNTDRDRCGAGRPG